MTRSIWITTKSPTPKPIPTVAPTLKPSVDLNNIKNEPKNPLTLYHNNIFNHIIGETTTRPIDLTVDTLKWQNTNAQNEFNLIEKDLV